VAAETEVLVMWDWMVLAVIFAALVLLLAVAARRQRRAGQRTIDHERDVFRKRYDDGVE
jgi:membrane protein implicated in regulation of membrane protease activity